MMHKSLRLALVGMLVASHAYALSEWRTPWIAERGPLRYTFEKLHKDKYNLNFWSVAHFKEADRAFLKHSTGAHHLTALIFNKADFTMNEIFPDAKVPFGVQDYSPFIKLAKFSPRACYTEAGLTFGGRWDCPVWKDKGRIGLRATVPFRRIEMHRDDIFDKNADPLADYVVSDLIKITRNSPIFNVAAVGAAASLPGSAVLAAHDAANGGNNNAVEATQNALNAVPAPKGQTVTSFDPRSTYMPDKPAVGAPQAAIQAAVGSTKSAAIATGDQINTAIATAIGGAADINAVDGTASQAVAAVIAAAQRANNKAAIVTPLTNGTITQVATDAINAAANRGDCAPTGEQPSVVCTAYRLDLVQSLEDTTYRSIIASDDGSLKIVGQEIAVSDNQRNRAQIGLTQGASPSDVAINGYAAWMPSNQSSPNGLGVAEVKVDDISKIPNDLSGSIGYVGYFSQDNGDYSGLQDADSYFATPAIAQSASQQWLTFRRSADSTDVENRFGPDPAGNTGISKSVADTIDNLLRQYRENPYSFLYRHGYEMETQIRRGFGDIDLDLFYEHTFNTEWMGELMVGTRIPVGGTDKKYGNPYKVSLGNGDHWEVKVGAMAAYQPRTWMNIKLDAYYSFVIEATEHRMAVFAGSTIKNMGPQADADVDWGYFVGRLDFNFFHPKTSDIRSLIGYEIYYKTEDHLTYKHASMESWLGHTWDYETPGQFIDNPQALDNHLARKNTESIGHKVRLESSYQLNKYLEVFTAGTWTFAGQNVMRDWDCQGGFNVRF